MGRKRVVLGVLLALFGAWAVAASLGALGQQKLFHEEWGDALSDFWMPRMCIEQGYVGRPEKYVGMVDLREGKPIEIDERDVVWSGWYTDGEKTQFVTGWRDKVYPAFALLPFRLFPASWQGAWLWAILAGLFFLGGLCLIARSWWPLLLMCSMPFIYSFERANPVWIAAACVGVFLAWWDDEKEWKRLVAASCLAVAGAMKIAPLVLGALYFTKWRWRPVVLCGVLVAVFVVVPWFFVQDGFAAFATMYRNALEHAQCVQRSSELGLVQLGRSVRIVLGYNVRTEWPGMKDLAMVSRLLGFGAIALGVWRRDFLLMTGGMLMAAGNMYYYGTLYLLPVFVLEMKAHEEGRERPSWVALVLWLALFSPVQLVFAGHSCNQVIGNMAVMSLMARRLLTA